jgi:hypothetical protein
MFKCEDAQPLRQEGQGAFSWPTPRGAASHQLKRNLASVRPRES